jgi:hypothetical protein
VVASFSTNGISHGPAFTRNGDEIHPLSKLLKTALFPAFCHKEASVTLNFGPFENIEERTSIFETIAPLMQEGAHSILTAKPTVTPTGIASNWIESELSGSGLVINNLQATNSTSTMERGTGSQSVSSGTAYYEATVNIAAERGFSILGWSTNTAGSILGLGFCSMVFYSFGQITYDSHCQNYCKEHRNGDVIGC